MSIQNLNPKSRRTFFHKLANSSAALASIPFMRANKHTNTPKRILVARFYDETNTFINERLTLEEVKKEALFGNDFLRKSGMVHGTVGTALDGFVDYTDMFDVELIGSIFVEGNHRTMTSGVFDFVTGHILESLDKHQVDAVYLSAHGAGVTEGHDDLEGETMQLIREKVGPDVPIVFSMDLHCTVTRLMTEAADAVSVYRTYPHIDAFETGYEVASILMATLFGKVKPVLAMHKLPLMIGPPVNVLTSDEPMRSVYAHAQKLQRTVPGILSCCPCHGFMQQDIPEQGAAVIVTADGDRDLAQQVADEVADLMYSHRKQFWVDLPSTVESVRLAKEAKRPVAISDSGDNIGAGGSADSAHLLREILQQNVKSAFVQMYDPDETKKAFAAGVGATVTLLVGGKSHPMHGPPVEITGQVTGVSKESDPWHPAVKLQSGPVTLLLNTVRIGPNDQTNVRSMGIYPEEFQMTVCKGGFAFRPQYPASVYDYILSATPGFSSPDLTTFDWKRIPRPIFPLDEI